MNELTRNGSWMSGGFSFLFGIVFLMIASPSGSAAFDSPDDLTLLSNAALLQELETRGLKLKGMASLTLQPFHRSGFGSNPEHLSSYRSCWEEVARRGVVIEDELLDMLRREIRLDRGLDAEYSFIRISLAGELLSLVEGLHTQKASSSLLEIIEGPADIAPSEYFDLIRKEAISTMEHVTYTTFRRGGDSSLGLRAVNAGQPFMDWFDVSEAAKRYRIFLDKHGHEEERWLANAIDQAHRNLRNEDPDQCYVAAEFLASGLRDTNPEETCRILAENIDRLSISEKDPTVSGRFYQWNRGGKPTARNGVEWCCLLSEFRGHAQPFFKSVPELSKRNELGAPYVTYAIGRIGGREALAELARIIAEAEQHEAEAREYLSQPNPDPIDPRGIWLQDQQFARTGFDSLAGRCFDNDQERLQWFELNRENEPEVWLRSSLPVYASEIESGNLRGYLPCYPDLFTFYYDPSQRKSFSAAKWVSESADRLEYDWVHHTLKAKGK